MKLWMTRKLKEWLEAKVLATGRRPGLTYGSPESGLGPEKQKQKQNRKQNQPNYAPK